MTEKFGRVSEVAAIGETFIHRAEGTVNTNQWVIDSRRVAAKPLQPLQFLCLFSKSFLVLAMSESPEVCQFCSTETIRVHFVLATGNAMCVSIAIVA